MEEKMLRGIQCCPVTAVHHTSWPRCSFLLNQMACCYPCAFLLLSAPSLFICYKQYYSLHCPAPLLQLQMQSYFHCGSLANHQAPSYRLHPTQERCTCGRWAFLMAFRILYCSLLEDMENLVWLAVVFCTEFSDCWFAILTHYQKDGLFRKIVAIFAQINVYTFTISTSE